MICDEFDDLYVPLLDKLEARERQVIELRFGLKGKKHTFTAIGKIITNRVTPGNVVSGTRVRQIMQKGLNKLYVLLQKQVKAVQEYQDSQFQYLLNNIAG